ncbi:MAG TPA: GNAT family N-acetyltransferase [Flavipsychrobacter sp.]|nr:GNAT family N-acetyltransferase [Flavipsychrobacter sp.]
MLTLNFDPFPVLETERLILRRPVMTDADEIYKYRSDAELMKYILHRFTTDKKEVVETIERVNALISNNEGINWAITLKGNETIVGMIGYVHFFPDRFRAEIGYMLHTPHHGKGIIHEAMKATIKYGFEIMNLHSIEAIVNYQNEASKKVLERLNFTKDAFFKDYLYLGGEFIDANVYSLIRK